MIQDIDIEQKLREYDEAFDFYMDKGSLPETILPNDPLGGFMEQAFADNPQLESQDPLWKEIFKDEMMKFIEAMLQIFQPIEEAYEREKQIILAFSAGEMSEKREMWQQVNQIILSNYKQSEVNIEGYIEQMKNDNPEPVLSSLAKDWEKACDEKIIREKQEIIEKNRRYWESHALQHGPEDYASRKKIEAFFYSYPQLVDIVRVLGREQPERKDELDENIIRYLPILPSIPTPAAEVEEISIGNNLQHLLPIETAVMSDKQTEDLFLLKYASRKLQLFANKPKNESRKKPKQQKNRRPRLEKGPIIVSIDTSGSMSGKPEKIARSLLIQLLRMAKKQKRHCFLIEFSVRAKSLDLGSPNAWSKLNAFLEDTFSGGTDGEQMLSAALNMLNTKKYSMADVLIISDFIFPLPRPHTKERMQTEHNKGTRFYGLQIGGYHNEYYTILDEIWKI